MKKIVALTGDFYHNESQMNKGLQDSIQILGINHSISTVKTGELLSTLAIKPDLVILSTENRINPEEPEVQYWMNEEIETKIIDYVNNGGSLLSWHSGLASYEAHTSFCSMLGGFFKYHPIENKEVRYYTQGQNYIHVFTDFTIIDEHYFVELDISKTNVFLYSQSTDGDSIAGWAHKFGKGKVCCLTPCHNEAGLSNNDFKKIFRDCLSWSLNA